MSRRIYWIAGLGIAATAAGGAQAQTMQPVPVFINGDRMGTEALMIRSVGRTVVPMRDLFESLGAQVEWDPSQRAVYAWRPDGIGVRLALNERSAHSMRMSSNPGPGNWGRVTATQRLDAPAMLVNRRIFVPLRFASEALQADVRFASYQPAVHISTQAVAGYRAEDVIIDEPVRTPRVEEPVEVLPRRRPRVNTDRSDDFPRRRPRLNNPPIVVVPVPVEPDRVERDPIFRPADIASALDVSIDIPTQRFGMDEEIPVRIIVRNNSHDTVTIPFRSGQRFDLEVLQEGRLIWNWARDRAFPQALHSITLRPGEDTGFNVRLRTNRIGGGPLDPGRYTLRAILTADLGGQPLASERPIRIMGR